MKLIFIANGRFPTEKVHGMHNAKMAEAFQKNGHSVELIAPRIPVKIIDPVSFYGLQAPLNIRRIWTWPWRTSRISFLLSSFIFGILSALVAMRRPGIIYSIDLDHFSFFLMPFLRKQYFFEIHSAKKRTIPHRLLFWKISGVIAINENVRSALEKTFPRLVGKILVFPNGVDMRKYEHAKPQSMEHPAVVYTGSFQGWKGLDTAIEAARILPQVHWYLVGGKAGELDKSIPENVHILPWDTDPIASARWQKGADFLLLSGTNTDEYSSRYTSPVKLCEYMAAGQPIIAAGTPAIKQAVSDDEVFFYKPDSAESLRDTIKKALAQPDEAKRKANLLKKRAHEYTWGNRAKHIVEFINKRAH